MAFLRSACLLVAMAPAAAVAAAANGAKATHQLRGVGEGALLPPNEEDDDGIVLLYDGANAMARPSPQMFGQSQKSGFELAKLWNECKHRLEYQRALKEHYQDTVASARHNFLYVENAKAGSTSVRKLLDDQLQITWLHTDIPGATNYTGGWQKMKGVEVRRHSSGDFTETSQMFKFSLVRDPVAKFESGVRQARKVERFQHMSADEVLEEVIRAGHVTEPHLAPSSQFLSTFDASIPPSMVSLDFIGKTEHIERDWPEIVDHLQGIGEVQKMEMKRSFGHDNARPRVSSSQLTEAGIRRMCESSLFKWEWACFDYELPHACNPGRAASPLHP